MTRLFVFDLGNVILPFENKQIARKLLARSRCECTSENIFHYLFDLHTGSINPYEEGHCSSLEFFLDVKNRFDLHIDFDEFKDIWNEIFTENAEVSGMIAELKARDFPLFLLSNTNELHFAHVIERYPIVHLMDEWILSFEVGAKKPKKRMYEAIFEKMDVRGDEVFYVDDVADYVNTARSMGIEGHVFREPAELRNALRATGAIG
jgi:putative hydrolase of the HAD superfamily